ncbi:MAG TPA: hypothetical protein VGZ29_06845 [Terriglobia bacterium]|nr:hypothetical protein [Terriglobia bacterium]
MSGLIVSGWTGVEVHAIHLKEVVLALVVWVIASPLFGLLLGRAWQLFGYGDGRSTETLWTAFGTDARPGVRRPICGEEAQGLRIDSCWPSALPSSGWGVRLATRGWKSRV